MAHKSPPTEKITDLQNSLPFLLRKTHRQLARALETTLQKKGLTSTHWYFLRAIWFQEGMTQAELSAQVGIMTPGTVTALNSLQRKNYIERRVDENDRRKTRIYSTSTGKALRRELLPLAQQVLSKSLAGISAGELQTFRKVLHRLDTNSRDLEQF